jgi:preprotein translocase subunit SecY
MASPVSADPLRVLWGWLALAIVLVALVELVPASNRFLVWTLGLVLVYLVLTHIEQWGGLVDALVSRLGG